MKDRIYGLFNSFGRFEQVLVLGVVVISLVLIPVLFLFVWTGDAFVQSIYEQRSLPILNQLIQNQDQFPLEHYLAIKKDVAFHLFVLWSLAAIFSISGFSILYRLFFSDKKLCPWVVILVCCLATALLFFYNSALRTTSVHTLFRAGPAYQILNGNIPPMDPLFGGEVLHYQWGYPFAAAMFSKIFNITPFSSFAVINVLSLGVCLWFLYKISNLLIDDSKVNIFSAFFTIYCGTIIHTNTLFKLKDVIPFYGGENRVFPLLVKFHNNNGAPLGLVFFLLIVYGTMRLFEKQKTYFYSFHVLLGVIGCLFFYAAYGPGILAWMGCLGLLWLTKYRKSDFKTFGRTLFLLYILIAISLLAVSPYLKQLASSGSFLAADLFNPEAMITNSLHFLLPSLIVVLIIIFYRKYLIQHINLSNASILGCLFLSSMTCYLSLHMSSSGEYKFLTLALVPLGIVGGIAFGQIKYFSKWAALGLFLVLCLPPLKLFEYQFKSSPRNIFDINYSGAYYENGTILESSDPEENAIYQWIRANTTMDTYFLDRETKIPVFAQRSLWVAFDNGEKLPGYAMTVSNIKELHGYDEQEFSRRQQIVQNLFGGENSMSNEEIASYLRQHRLYVVVRNHNVKIPLGRYGLQEVFASETGQYKILGN